MKKSILIMLTVLTASLAFGQGGLIPSGAPAPTMKTLNQVEPRTPISSAPVTISQSGSYYLTTNLTGTVTIAADNVTLDLMGFTIAPASGTGIRQAGARTNLLVRNGIIAASAGNGIDFSVSGAGANGVLEDLRVTECGVYGIAVGSGFTVRRCHIDGVSSAGIRGYGNSRIIGNTVVNCAIGIQLSESGAYVADNMVKGNADNYVFADGNQLNILLSEVPETIDWPCTVKLAGSLSSTGHGVVITSDDVTLDLMGFTLSGDGGFYDYGVFVDGATNSVIEHVVIRNGAVKNFAIGIRAEYSMGGRFEKLAVLGNNHTGVYLDGSSGHCNGNTVADCTLSGNGSFGVSLDGISGHCNGNRVADCTISENGSNGIYLSGGSGQCDGNTVADCTLSENGGRGVYLSGSSGQCNGNTVADCTLSGNSSYGVYLYGYFGECDGNTIADCSISANGNYGVYLYGYNGQCDGNTVADCTIRKNTNRGIYVTYADSNRVDGNHVTGQTGPTSFGISCLGTADNLIIRNSCVGQTNNFSLSANDTSGPVVTTAGALSGTDPWANFSR